jgi:hypothetical protein
MELFDENQTGLKPVAPEVLPAAEGTIDRTVRLDRAAAELALSAALPSTRGAALNRPVDRDAGVRMMASGATHFVAGTHGFMIGG